MAPAGARGRRRRWPQAVAAPARGAAGECGGERSDGGVSRWLITVGEPEDPLRAPKAAPVEEVGHMKVPGPALGALGLPAEENRHRAQRRVARGRVRIADRTLVLAIGAVAAVVVAVFDRAPVLAHRGQELVRRGRARRATGQTEDPSMAGSTAVPFQTCRSMRRSCAAPAKFVANGSVGPTLIRRHSRRPWSLSNASA